MDDSNNAVAGSGQGAISLDEMSRSLAEKMLAEKSAGSWRQCAIAAQAAVESRVSALCDWAARSSLDGRAAWDRFCLEITGITWDKPGGIAEIDLYYSCKACNGTSRIINVESANDLEDALWRASCDAMARAHPWLGELEPLTDAELKSGQFQVEGDGGSSFMQGLSDLGPDGVVFAEQVSRRRQLSWRIRDLEREWAAALSLAVGSKAFPTPVKDVSGSLSVKLEPIFMADGSFMIGADSVVKKNGRAASGPSFAKQGRGPVALGAASASESQLWDAFSSLLVDRMSKAWSDADIDACVPAAEALVLNAQPSGASAKAGTPPRI